MDLATAQLLSEETTQFYRACADSFSQTRHAAWAGWGRVFDGPAGVRLFDADTVSVLDVACGNMRFERFLRERYASCSIQVHAVDNCTPLVGERRSATFHELDILGELERGSLDAALDMPSCDLVACFGFMHHVPGRDNRVRLLRVLAGKVKPGGFLVVSFWQFLNSPELARKARLSHERGLVALGARGLKAAQLEDDDFLLGWQEREDIFRYCHNFTNAEISSLAEDAGLAGRIVDRFEADGRTGNLNAYLVISA